MLSVLQPYCPVLAHSWTSNNYYISFSTPNSFASKDHPFNETFLSNYTPLQSERGIVWHSFVIMSLISSFQALFGVSITAEQNRQGERQ